MLCSLPSSIVVVIVSVICYEFRVSFPTVSFFSLVVVVIHSRAGDFLSSKPFRFGELVARLRAVLRRTVPENAGVTVLQTGTLEIDFDRRFLRRAGKPVHLTPTEFDLLALLMRNQACCSRTPSYFARSGAPNTPAQPKYILTEPWVGYRFHNPTDSELESRGTEPGR